MPFTEVQKKAERALAQIRETVRQTWGVELSALYPALVARIGQTDFQFELTPLLRNGETGRAVLFGSREGENLVIERSTLRRGWNRSGDKYKYVMESALVRPIISGGKVAETKREKDLAKLAESFGEWARIEYLFDSVPQVPQAGLPARTYIIDFSQGGSVNSGLLRCFSFLLSADWQKKFVLGGVKD